LADGLRGLATADPRAAAALGLELLPAQGLAVAHARDYDLLLPGTGCFRVTVGPEGPGTVSRLIAPRGRREADFRLETDASGLAELLVAGGPGLPRRAARVRPVLRRSRARSLPATPLSLARMAEVGIWLDPVLLYRALAVVIDASWTRGQSFSVHYLVTGPGIREETGRSFHVVVHDAQPIQVGEGPPPGRAGGTVHASQSAFQHVLDGRPRPPGGKASMRGDARALGLITQWTEWAVARGARGA
jgi:hypothetical protein